MSLLEEVLTRVSNLEQEVKNLTTLEVKFKKLNPNAKVPEAKHDAVSYDIFTLNDVVLTEQAQIVPTGIAVELPKGYEMVIKPRSSSGMLGVILTNSPGTIDSDYRGDVGILARFNYKAAKKSKLDKQGERCFPLEDGRMGFKIKAGERIGQCHFQRRPNVTFVEVEELSDTERGSGGFGSTGK